MMYTSLKGKRALVTGGGRGIGRVIAQCLMKSGAKTIVLTKSLRSVSKLKEEDPGIEVVQVNLADWDDARRIVESLLPIDLLVNNAGIITRKPFVDYDEEDINNILKVNYKAVFNISQTVCADLIRRGNPGSIVNISSVGSKICRPSFSVVGSLKAALDSLTKYMALEMGPKKIRVNAVNPMVIKTDMTKPMWSDPEALKALLATIPIGRIGEKADVAEVVLFLLSDHASLVNGVTLSIDGGQTL